MTAVVAQLPRTPDSVRTARLLVNAQAGDLRPGQREDVGLMVSELVTNALRHGSGPITLRMDPKPDSLRIEVSDEGHGTVIVDPAPGAGGGWGLRLVDLLADRWGVEEGSTRVWFSCRR